MDLYEFKYSLAMYGVPGQLELPSKTLSQKVFVSLRDDSTIKSTNWVPSTPVRELTTACDSHSKGWAPLTFAVPMLVLRDVYIHKNKTIVFKIIYL